MKSQFLQSKIKKLIKKSVNSSLKPFNYKMTADGLRHILEEEYDEIKVFYLQHLHLDVQNL